jgi:hypothetical protein
MELVSVPAEDAPDPNDTRFIAAPTDRRPDFTAQALSPAFRVGLLFVVLTIDFALIAAVAAMALEPFGVFALGEFVGVMYLGSLVALSFFAFLVFGAFLGNNPDVGPAERWVWYALFLTAGPLALPVYWWIHIWPAAFQPMTHQTT